MMGWTVLGHVVAVTKVWGWPVNTSSQWWRKKKADGQRPTEMHSLACFFSWLVPFSIFLPQPRV